METRRCGHCGETKPEADWHPSQWSKGGWCKECYRAWHRARYAPKDGADDAPRDCAWCGASYRPKNRRPSSYCSGTCKDKAKNAAWAAANQAKKPTDRHCMHCGDPLPQRMRADALFCSAECKDKAHALQRKLRARTGEEGKPGYLRAFICERDRWRCGICTKPVDRQRQYPDPLCASLDHVIPISQGGTNDVWNLRLTHLVCNLSRRAGGGGEQLAML